MTTDKIPFASDAARAMSIFGDKESLIVGTATIIITAAVYGYRAFKAYEAKKHHQKIVKVNDLHQKYLETIIVPQFGKIKGLPSIFQFKTEAIDSPVESMHFTDNQIMDIGTNKTVKVDTGLLGYQENLKNAIFKLKEYYIERGKKEDVTAGVLSYLMYILNEKCTQFSGYKYDIEYMEAIGKFVNAYASIKGIQNSQHYSRLNIVYMYINKAKQELINYKNYLSLEYFVSQLAQCGMTNGDLLIRSFTKLIVEKDRYHLLDTVAQDEIKKGILRREYDKGEIKGFVYAKHHQVDIPKSVFKNWIINLSNFYLKSKLRDKNLKEMGKFSPELMIHYIENEHDHQKRTFPYLLTRNTKKDFENQLNEVREIFKKTSNFMTTKLDKGCGLFLRKEDNDSFENSNENHLYLYKGEHPCNLLQFTEKSRRINFNSIKGKINNQDAIILINKKLYYANVEKRKLSEIKKNKNTQSDYDEIFKNCTEKLQTANETQLNQITSLTKRERQIYLYFYIDDKKHIIKKESFVMTVSELFDSFDTERGNLLESDLLDSISIQECENLLTYTAKKGFTKVAKKHSHPVFIPITDHNEVMARTKTMAKFARLIYTIISLQYFCIHLLNSIKELGDIYVKDPRHFVEIFELLEKLSTKICDDINELQSEFIEIQKENNNEMRLVEEEMIPKQINALLIDTKDTIIDLIKDIKDYRNNAKQLSAKSEKQAVNSEMLKLARKISNFSHIDNKAEPSKQNVEFSLSNSTELSGLNNQSMKKKRPVLYQNKSMKDLQTEMKDFRLRQENHSSKDTEKKLNLDEAWPLEQLHMVTEIPNDQKDTLTSGQTSSEIQNRPTLKAPSFKIQFDNKAEKSAVEKLQDALSGIKGKIEQISKENTNIKILIAYQKIYDHLNIMATKSIQMLNQQNKSDLRTIKANQTFALVDRIVNDTLQHMSFNQESRTDNSLALAKNVHEKVTNDRNGIFIDEHQNKFSKFMYTHVCKFGIFRTDTRKKLNNLDEAYQQLIKN